MLPMPAPSRRGRRPRRPALFSLGKESSALPSAGHFWPQRRAAQALSVPPAAPFLSAAKEMGEKNAAKNQWFLEFLSSDHSHAAKRPTPNRSCPYPRCRFHMPRGNAVSYRRGTVYLRVVRRSGSDKRTARDSLYDDVRQFKSRVVRGGGFQRTPAAQEVLKPAVSSSVLVTFGAAAKSDPRSEVRCPPFEKKNERAVEDDADPCKKHIALQKKEPRALGRGIPVTINRCPA